MAIDYDDIKGRIPRELRDKILSLGGKKKRVMKKEILPDLPPGPVSDKKRAPEWKICKKHGMTWIGDWPCVFCEDPING